MPRNRSDDDGQRDREPYGDERPWDEARWRKFLHESDVRAARYAELFETLLDDPQRDRKIAREMGWDDEPPSDTAGGAGFDADDSDDDLNPPDGNWHAANASSNPSDFDAAAELELLNDFDPNDPELIAEAEADRKALHAIPAYRTGNRLAKLVLQAMRPFEDIEDERLGTAIEHALIPGAKVAGGHGIGYEDDAICGNIVCNTIALDHARKALVDFTELKDDAVLPAVVVDGILVKVRELIGQLETRIGELRARVTW